METMKEGLVLAMQTDVTLWKPKSGISPKAAGSIVCGFLDTATTSMGRATHYNSREEQQAAELRAHALLLDMSRDLYAVMLALPGVTDRAVQVGMKNLLSTHPNGAAEFLPPAGERAVLYHLMQALPPQRMLKMVEGLRVGDEEQGLKKANNARTRKLILRTLLSSPRLQLWAVKYRRKMKAALVHAWGERKASIIRSILAKDDPTHDELDMLRADVDSFAGDSKVARECAAFILGVRGKETLPLLKAFSAAKTDIKAAKGIGFPPEVLEGIRGQFHKDVPHAVAVETAKDGMTAGQKMNMQREAKNAGVKVDLDPTQYDPVRLYLYAFEMGMDEKIQKALAAKAKKLAAGFPAHYGTVGIVVDASASMAGDKTQALRPMACALAMRDMLQHVGDEAVVAYVGGTVGDSGSLVRPMGDTALADGLVQVLSSIPAPEAVFVVSDGYENCPAGRFAEVVAALKEIGIEVPIFHLNPVFASETTGCRELAPALVPTMPVRSPEGLGTTIIRGLLEADPLKGINALVRLALVSGPVEMKALAKL